MSEGDLLRSRDADAFAILYDRHVASLVDSNEQRHHRAKHSAVDCDPNAGQREW